MSGRGYSCGCHLGHRSAQEHSKFWETYKARRKHKIANKTKKKKDRKPEPPKPRKFVHRSYHQYLNSDTWRHKREEAFKYHGKKCNVCGATEDLQVHHKTYKSIFRERMKHLEILCRGCHENKHEAEGKALDPMTREYLSLNL